MSTAPDAYGGHPAAVALARIHAELDGLAEVGLWSMSPEELAETLPGWTKARARVAEVELRTVHQAAQVGLGSEVGAADAVAWWANTTRLTRAEAHRLAKLAAALDSQHEPVRHAMAAGTCWSTRPR